MLETKNHPGPVGGRTRARLTIVALVVMFVAPIVVAWLMTRGVIDIGGVTRDNFGEILVPPIDLEAVGAERVSGYFDLAPSEWAMLVVTPTACDADCKVALDRLHGIHQVLGHDGLRVKYGVLAAAPGTAEVDPRRVLVDAAASAALEAGLAGRTAAIGGPAIVLVDWRNQVAERFAIDADQADIKHDLKTLLRASRIR